MKTLKSNHSMSGKCQQGSSLIEVLVTMLIVAVGLLGAGGMQIASTRYQQTAFMRSQAIEQAQFIAEKMKANSVVLVISAVPSPASHYLAPEPYGTATLAALPADPGCGLTAGSTCTGLQSAVKDMRDWRTSVAALPGGRGSIEPVIGGAATDPVARRVVVMWQEKQENEVDANAAVVDDNCTAPRVAGVRCYTMVVMP